MKVSCGFIVVHRGKWLVGHVTGGKNWDFPKGAADENEEELEAALRETREESGLDLRPHLSSAVDHGRHPYRPNKDLHLWSIEVPELNVAELFCESMVVRPNYSFPEIDGFMLIDPATYSNFLAKGMQEWVTSHVLNKS